MDLQATRVDKEYRNVERCDEVERICIETQAGERFYVEAAADAPVHEVLASWHAAHPGQKAARSYAADLDMPAWDSPTSILLATPAAVQHWHQTIRTIDSDVATLKQRVSSESATAIEQAMASSTLASLQKQRKGAASMLAQTEEQLARQQRVPWRARLRKLFSW